MISTNLLTFQSYNFGDFSNNLAILATFSKKSINLANLATFRKMRRFWLKLKLASLALLWQHVFIRNFQSMVRNMRRMRGVFNQTESPANRKMHNS